MHPLRGTSRLKLGVFGANATHHVVCRASQAEAEDYYEHYAARMKDSEAVDRHVGGKERHAGSHGVEAFHLHHPRFAGGAGTYPLVGMPARIAEELARISAAGYAGAALSFVNYRDELPDFAAACCHSCAGWGCARRAGNEVEMQWEKPDEGCAPPVATRNEAAKDARGKRLGVIARQKESPGSKRPVDE